MVYDPQYEQPALLVGDYEIHFDYYYDEDLEDPERRAAMDILELAGVVDSPISSIEWGQPVFYNSYHLTTPEYLPR